eukprot:SAG31_NODE_2288_length_6003_cov_1.876355_1_plen_194_part_00
MQPHSTVDVVDLRGFRQHLEASPRSSSDDTPIDAPAAASLLAFRNIIGTDHRDPSLDKPPLAEDIDTGAGLELLGELDFLTELSDTLKTPEAAEAPHLSPLSSAALSSDASDQSIAERLRVRRESNAGARGADANRVATARHRRLSMSETLRLRKLAGRRNDIGEDGDAVLSKWRDWQPHLHAMYKDVDYKVL